MNPRKATIRFKYHDAPLKGVRESLRSLASFARKALAINQNITVDVSPKFFEAIDTGDGRFGFGVFRYKDKSKRIAIAQGAARHGLDSLQQILLHELIHFEQYCQSKRVIETGVAKRTNALMRRFMEASA